MLSAVHLMSTMSYDRILGVSPWFGLVGQGLMGFLGILAGLFITLFASNPESGFIWSTLSESVGLG